MGQPDPVAVCWVCFWHLNVCDSWSLGTLFEFRRCYATAASIQFIVARSTLCICCKRKCPCLAPLDRSYGKFCFLFRRYLGFGRALAKIPVGRKSSVCLDRVLTSAYEGVHRQRTGSGTGLDYFGARYYGAALGPVPGLMGGESPQPA